MLASSFECFLQRAWADHAENPDAAAQRVGADTPAPDSAKQLSALVQLAVHLCGEHLGAFDDGRWRLAELASHPLADAGAAVHRPPAVTSNDMAWDLHDRGSARSGAETAVVLDLAAASKEPWLHAGPWLEAERGDRALALCHVWAGQPGQAMRFARQCLDACVQNNAPVFAHFFAHEALARAQHAGGDATGRARCLAAAAAAFAKLADDDREACHATLGALQALTS